MFVVAALATVLACFGVALIRIVERELGIAGERERGEIEIFD